MTRTDTRVGIGAAPGAAVLPTLFLPLPAHAATTVALPWPLLAGAVVFGAAVALAAIAGAQWLRARQQQRDQTAFDAELRSAISAAADFVWRADAAGKVQSITATGARPVPAALSTAAGAGTPLWQLADATAPCPPELKRALETRTAIGQHVVELADGDDPNVTEPWLLAAAFHGSDTGGCYVGIGRCLASLAPLLGRAGSAEQATEIERLRAEASERSRQHELAARELDSFAHSVSHDLRAPLRVVDGFATILLEDYAHPHKAVDALGEEHIRRIIGAGTRMNAMIDTLLAMSRMTSRDLERERVNLSQLARELADELKAGDRSRQVQFSITPDLVVEGDRTLLRLVLQNLIGNAFKFTGRVAVAKIAVGAQRDDNGHLAYHVRDNGAGFDPRFAEKMFGLFQRFHSANEFPGTGVGLATVQRIVRKHGGRIWAESQPGEGATFHFTLWEQR